MPQSQLCLWLRGSSLSCVTAGVDLSWTPPQHMGPRYPSLAIAQRDPDAPPTELRALVSVESTKCPMDDVVRYLIQLPVDTASCPGIANNTGIPTKVVQTARDRGAFHEAGVAEQPMPLARAVALQRSVDE
jgi:hypothetical protein